MPNELLTIGRFARLCRLSVKQLRHYDELRLLAPVRVDRGTGYRYYAPEQARDALTISLLRDMDLPLAVIAEALAAEGASRARILRAERDRLAERISRDEQRLEILERLVEGGLPGYEVSTGREPERRLAVVRAVCTREQLGETAGACVGRLLAALAEAGTAWEPPLWGLYPLDLQDRLRIAIGAQAPHGPDAPGLEYEVLRGGLVAETVHTGPYTQLPLAYNALFATIHERGLRPQAPVREAYLVGPGEAPQEDLMTRLTIPVERSAA
ncbi:MerR family transcriptional regulator [Kitasatospora sp. NPDC048239]|uniref:MerR family transcriptional regulator n=1 Tax=Kitasatospora sp. NPDC048239 TaxID=3364046 RepID=UPI0037220579